MILFCSKDKVWNMSKQVFRTIFAAVRIYLQEFYHAGKKPISFAYIFHTDVPYPLVCVTNLILGLGCAPRRSADGSGHQGAPEGHGGSRSQVQEGEGPLHQSLAAHGGN